MLLKIALLLSMLFQLGAAIVAVSLIRRTHYNVSWILISGGFVLMAVRRLIDFSAIFWETQIISNDNVTSWISVVISVLMMIGLIYIRQIFNLQDRMDEMRKESETRLLSAVIQGEERARQTIARDLHDGLGPLLSSIKMIVSATDPDKMDLSNKKIIERSGLVIDEAIITLKEISNHLSPHMLKNFGLSKAIETFAGHLLENSHTQFCMESNIDEKRFDYELETSIYHVVSELLNNSVKHGNPGLIRIEMNDTGGFIQIVYKDDGCGFNPDDIKRGKGSKGMGLGNIESRIKSLDGNFYIDSAHGKGVSVYIQAPLT
jgi:signal transduction histidine kinase